ncbi:hypothetical protein L1887_61911 [Cichorium endivia]|nr:hypothetical protein L1887_61911 [Cichorium endivia]
MLEVGGHNGWNDKLASTGYAWGAEPFKWVEFESSVMFGSGSRLKMVVVDSVVLVLKSANWVTVSDAIIMSASLFKRNGSTMKGEINAPTPIYATIGDSADENEGIHQVDRLEQRKQHHRDNRDNHRDDDHNLMIDLVADHPAHDGTDHIAKRSGGQ